MSDGEIEMIDINELRRLAQAATPHVGHACKYQDAHWLREGHVDFENADLFIASERPQEDAAFYAAANPATVIELLGRLEDAESDALEQARLNGMGSERETALMAKLEAAEKERDWNAERLEDAIEELTALRAKIEAMENQEPVKIQHRVPFVNSNGELVGYSVWIDGRGFDHWPHRSLYALPGAKGEEK